MIRMQLTRLRGLRHNEIAAMVVSGHPKHIRMQLTRLRGLRQLKNLQPHLLFH